MGIKRPSFSAAAAASQINYETVYLNGGHIDILSGSQPVGGPDEDITTQTVLCTFSLQNPAFSNPVNGEASVNGAPLTSSPAVATGTASWFRAYGGAGLPVIDGTVGTGTEFDINLDTVDIVTGTTYTLDTLSIVGGVGVPVQTVSAHFTRTSDGAVLGLDDVPVGRTRLTDPVTGQPSQMSVWRSGDGYDCVLFENGYIGISNDDVVGHQVINCKGVIISDEDVVIYPYTMGPPRWGTKPQPLPINEQRRWAVPNYDPDIAYTSVYTANMENPVVYNDQAGYPSNLAATGDSGHIGLLPRWDIPYFFSNTAEDAQVIRYYADVSHLLRTRYLDPATNELASTIDHPGLSSNNGSSTTTIPVGFNGSNPVVAVQSFSHFPAAGAAATIVFDTDYDRELLLATALEFGVSGSPTYRDQSRIAGTSYPYSTYPQGALCQIIAGLGQQARGSAWGIRSILQATTLVPYEEPYAHVLDCFQLWLDVTVETVMQGPECVANPYNYTHVNDWNISVNSTPSLNASNYQEFFIISAIDYAVERLGATAWKAFRDWKAYWAWKSFTEFSYQLMSMYRTRVIRENNSIDGFHPVTYPTTTEAYMDALAITSAEQATKSAIFAVLQHGSGVADLGQGPGVMYGNPFSYRDQASPAIAAVVNAGLPGAGSIWNTYNAKGRPTSGLADNPKYCIVPNVSIPVDTLPAAVPVVKPPNKPNVQVGMLIIPAGDTTVTISGLDFAPQAVMLLSRDGDAYPPYPEVIPQVDPYRDITVSIGAFDANSQWALESNVNYGSSPTQASSVIRNDCCFAVPGSYQLSKGTLNADGFTVNVDVTSGTQMYVSFVAFGGTGLDAAVGLIDTPTSNGVQTYATGLSSNVSGLITVGGSGQGTALASNFQTSIGIASLTSQATVGSYIKDAASPVAAQRYASTSNVVALHDEASLEVLANLASASAGGFTLNYSASAATSRAVGYLALAGLQLHVGTFTFSGYGHVHVSGLGFKPQSVLFIAADSIANEVLSNNAVATFAACSDAQDQSALVCWYENDGSSTSQAASFYSPFMGVMMSPAKENQGGRAAQLQFIEFEADGFHMLCPDTDWGGSASGTVYYIAIADSA